MAKRPRFTAHPERLPVPQFAILFPRRRLLENASMSPMLNQTLVTLTHDRQTGRFSPGKLR